MYSYAHVPWLKRPQRVLAAHLPEGTEKFAIFVSGIERFVAAGYVYIGMDHFALPHDEIVKAQKDRTLTATSRATRRTPAATSTGSASRRSARWTTRTSRTRRTTPSTTPATEEGRFSTVKGLPRSRPTTSSGARSSRASSATASSRSATIEKDVRPRVVRRDVRARGRRGSPSSSTTGWSRSTPDEIRVTTHGTDLHPERGHAVRRLPREEGRRRAEDLLADALSVAETALGVLLVQLGGPARREELRPFLYELFVDPEILGIPFAPLPAARRVDHRDARAPKSAETYERIGWSPIRRWSETQARLLEAELALRAAGAPAPVVRVGMTCSAPTVEDALEDLRDGGRDAPPRPPALPAVLRDDDARLVRPGRRRPSRRWAGAPSAVDAPDAWYDEPRFVAAHVDRIRAAPRHAARPRPREDRHPLFGSLAARQDRREGEGPVPAPRRGDGEGDRRGAREPLPLAPRLPVEGRARRLARPLDARRPRGARAKGARSRSSSSPSPSCPTTSRRSTRSGSSSASEAARLGIPHYVVAEGLNDHPAFIRGARRHRDRDARPAKGGVSARRRSSAAGSRASRPRSGGRARARRSSSRPGRRPAARSGRSARTASSSSAGPNTLRTTEAAEPPPRRPRPRAATSSSPTAEAPRWIVRGGRPRAIVPGPAALFNKVFSTSGQAPPPRGAVRRPARPTSLEDESVHDFFARRFGEDAATLRRGADGLGRLRRRPEVALDPERVPAPLGGGGALGERHPGLLRREASFKRNAGRDEGAPLRARGRSTSRGVSSSSSRLFDEALRARGARIEMNAAAVAIEGPRRDASGPALDRPDRGRPRVRRRRPRLDARRAGDRAPPRRPAAALGRGPRRADPVSPV